MTDSDGLITIGVLARASGLTPSALRFYDDCGLLRPAQVDEATGYRYYRAAQTERAVLIRRLRGIAVPLEAILSGDAATAAHLLDAHVLELAERARDAAVVADAVKQALAEPMTHSVVLSAALLVDAVEQVRTAAALDREIPVLAGILVEVGAAAVTFTATDRYRLSTRTVVPRRSGAQWSRVVDASETADLAAWLRDADEVVMAPGDGGIELVAGDDRRCCAVLGEAFPDYRAMIAALAPVRTRVLVTRAALLSTLEDGGPGGRDTAFGLPERQLTLVAEGAGVLVSWDGGVADKLSATVTGPTIELTFSPSTLRSALVTAVGPEIMLDIAAADQPVLVRSATDGDLTTLVMPAKPMECSA